MFRIVLISILFLLTIATGILAASRATMDYNEQGRYFDGLVVYDIARLEVYFFLTIVFLALSLVSIIFLKKSGTAKVNK